MSEMMGVEFGYKNIQPRAGSFTKARYTLAPAAMLAMYQLALQSSSAIAERNRWLWRGYRLVATDGSRFLLPAAEELIAAYKVSALSRPFYFCVDRRHARRPEASWKQADLFYSKWTVGGVDGQAIAIVSLLS